MKAIVSFSNQINGYIGFEQHCRFCPVIIHFKLSGFIPYSTHAVHIHEYGDLTQTCKSLGGHFNPHNKDHLHSEMGHAGDLFNNITTDQSGNFYSKYTTYSISLYNSAGTTDNSVIGRSIVIHKFPDDYGLMGIIVDSDNKKFTYYRDLNDDKLFELCDKLGYTIKKNRKDAIKKLEIESKTTGNASTRIACGIIGICNPSTKF